MYIITHNDVFIIMRGYSICNISCMLLLIYVALLYCMRFNMII